MEIVPVMTDGQADSAIDATLVVGVLLASHARVLMEFVTKPMAPVIAGDIIMEKIVMLVNLDFGVLSAPTAHV